MPRTTLQLPYTCARCLRASSRHNATSISSRGFSQHLPLSYSAEVDKREVAEEKEAIEKQILKNVSKEPKEPGAMSRRLAQATEDALLEGGRAGRKAVEEAGFSEELKSKLLEKVQAQKFRSEHSSAFTEAGLSSYVGAGSRDIATAKSWTGEENQEDTVLRMLDDTRKPLKPANRGPAKIPLPVADMRLKRDPKQTSGQRFVNARDKTSMYAMSKDNSKTEAEKEEWRRELQERFTPGARAMPNTLRGLTALANERIEDAVARGQFKNIPRGKGIERDTRADNPFLDTTEYILNKMIQRQDIVPPWIEKQQELVKATNVFRARLRNDWKRHAARTIASRGGTLQEQMQIAERYAESERINNSSNQAVEKISLPTSPTGDPVTVKITQTRPPEGSSKDTSLIKVSVDDKDAELTIPQSDTPQESTQTMKVSETPLPAPFRIPSWEAAEMSYLKLAITNLNNLARSYNLMAPEVARKPYFSLDRELKSCYSDVAPQLSTAIKERAARPAKDLVEKIGHRPGSVLERFGGQQAVVHDSKKPNYGFKEFWTDLFRKEA